eukprot:5276185-Pyramimonas_sp.AAC.2
MSFVIFVVFMCNVIKSLRHNKGIRYVGNTQPKHGGEPEVPNAQPWHPRYPRTTTQALVFIYVLFFVVVMCYVIKSLAINPGIRYVSDPQPRHGVDPE